MNELTVVRRTAEWQRLKPLVLDSVSSPIPTWVKVAIDGWTDRTGVADGRVFRPLHRGDELRGDRLSEKVGVAVPAAIRGGCWRCGHRAPRPSSHDGEIVSRGRRRTRADPATAGARLRADDRRHRGTKRELIHAPTDGIRLRVTVLAAKPRSPATSRFIGSNLLVSAPLALAACRLSIIPSRSPQPTAIR